MCTDQRGGDVARLTEKQKRFVEEYLLDLNATQAAIRAGYSEKTAQEQSSRLLSNVMVQEAVQKAVADRSARTEITQDAVLRELAAIGFSRATDFAKITANGCVKLTPTVLLSDEQQRAVASIKKGKYGVELRLHDKLGALQLIGRHIGMFTGKEEQKDEVEDDGLMAALEKIAGNIFDDGDDSDMLPKEKDE